MVDTESYNRHLAFWPGDMMVRVTAAVVISVTLRFCMWIYGIDLSNPYLAVMIVSALLSLILFRSKGPEGYRAAHRFWSGSIPVLSRWFLLFAILLALGYATKTSSLFSRKLIFTWLVVTPTLLIPAIFAIKSIVLRMVLSTDRTRTAIIAGANDQGIALAARLDSDPQIRLTLAGFFDDRSTERLGDVVGLRLLGKLGDVPQFVREQKIDVIYITLPLRNIKRVSDLLDGLHDTTASIYYVPDLFVLNLMQFRTAAVQGMPVVALHESPLNGVSGAVKKASDYLIASIVLALTSPLLLLIALAIKTTSPGTVFIKQRRYGPDGKEIDVYKFRSMEYVDLHGDSGATGRISKRVTRIGALLRRFSLDELPQFVNVLQGRLSVVGPKASMVSDCIDNPPTAGEQPTRYRVNPGIVDIAEIFETVEATAGDSIRDGASDQCYEYVRNWSLLLDIQLMAKSLGRILTGNSAAY